MKLNVQEINGKLAVIIPDDFTKSLNLRSGDSLFATKDENGNLVLTPYNPELVNIINAYELFSKRHGRTLEKLFG